MVLAVSAGVVKVAPVKMDVSPVGVVNQSKVAPAVVDDAVMVAVCPGLIACVAGVTPISGAPFTVTAALTRVVDTLPDTGAVAST